MDPVQGQRDTVYRAVLHTYMMECLRAGHNLEFFIEGGRTRTGKACLPRGELKCTAELFDWSLTITHCSNIVVCTLMLLFFDGHVKAVHVVLIGETRRTQLQFS